MHRRRRRPKSSYLNIPAIVAACEITGADAVHPGYGFLAENARFAEILEEHAITFIGPTCRACPHHGRQDRGQGRPRRRSASRSCRARGPGRDIEEAKSIASDIGYPVLVKASAGGGGRGMKLALDESRARARAADRAQRGPAPPSATTPSISRSISTIPATSRCRCSATATATPSISASATARCSGATRSSGRRRPRPRSTRASATRIGETVAKAMRELALSRRRHRRVPLRGRRVLFHRDEHAPPGRAPGHRDDHRARPRHRADPDRRRRAAVAHARRTCASTATPSSAASTPRTRTPSGPRPARSPISIRPAGLGVRVDSGAYAGYTIPPYYDSLIGKLIVHARTRNECLMRLKRALGEFVVDGIETTIPLFNVADLRARHRRRQLRHPLARDPSRQARETRIGRMTSIDDVMIEITPQVLLKAYACGIFPMAESAEDNALYWIEPEQRGILPLDHVHVPRRLARTIRRGGFEVKIDNDFEGGDRRLRRAALGAALDLDQRPHQGALSRPVRARPLPHGRGVAGRRARRRALRRASRPRLLRREHVLAASATPARSRSSISWRG